MWNKKKIKLTETEKRLVVARGDEPGERGFGQIWVKVVER